MLLANSTYRIVRDYPAHEFLTIRAGALVVMRTDKMNMPDTGFWFDPPPKEYLELVECSEKHYTISVGSGDNARELTGYGLRTGVSYAAILRRKSKQRNTIMVYDGLEHKECDHNHYEVVDWIARNDRLILMAQKESEFRSTQLFDFYHQGVEGVLSNINGRWVEMDYHQAVLAMMENGKLAANLFFRKDYP